MMSLRLLPCIAVRRATFGLLALAVLCPALSLTALGQDSPDERRCTGQWRASNDERITSCTALLDSGRYQPPNLAILRHDRGVALRAKGDIAGAINDFAEAIKLNPDYARAYADRGSARLMQHDLDGAIADLDAAIGLEPNDAGALMTRGNAFDDVMACYHLGRHGRIRCGGFFGSG